MEFAREQQRTEGGALAAICSLGFAILAVVSDMVCCIPVVGGIAPFLVFGCAVTASAFAVVALRNSRNDPNSRILASFSLLVGLCHIVLATGLLLMQLGLASVFGGLLLADRMNTTPQPSAAQPNTLPESPEPGD